MRPLRALMKFCLNKSPRTSRARWGLRRRRQFNSILHKHKQAGNPFLHLNSIYENNNLMAWNNKSLPQPQLNKKKRSPRHRSFSCYLHIFFERSIKLSGELNGKTQKSGCVNGRRAGAILNPPVRMRRRRRRRVSCMQLRGEDLVWLATKRKSE